MYKCILLFDITSRKFEKLKQYLPVIKFTKNVARAVMPDDISTKKFIQKAQYILSEDLIFLVMNESDFATNWGVCSKSSTRTHTVAFGWLFTKE